MIKDINIIDKYNIHDSFNGIRGWVECYLDNEKFFEGSNLVVYGGREFAASKLAGVDTAGNESTPYEDYYISHFGIGAGGAIIDNSSSPPTISLTGPTGSDIGLITPIMLSAGNPLYLDDCGVFTSQLGDPSYYSKSDAVKPINMDTGSIKLENDVNSQLTKIHFSCFISDSEPDSLLSGESVMINEAMLYYVPRVVSPACPLANSAKPFAHICFPPKWKEKDSKFKINWTILC